MKRRSFLSWFSLGWIASSLPVAIAACSPTTQETVSTQSRESSTKPSPRSDGFDTIGTVADLDRDGQVENRIRGINVGVIRNPSDSSELLAFDLACTHTGCRVDWNASEKQFLCPCHGSKFTPDGSAAVGPATKPLERYEAKIEGDKVLAKINPS